MRTKQKDVVEAHAIGICPGYSDADVNRSGAAAQRKDGVDVDVGTCG